MAVAVSAPPHRRRSISWTSPVTYGLAFVVASVSVAPVAYVILGGFRNTGQILTSPAALPHPWIFANYKGILGKSTFWRLVFNSTLISVTTTALVVVLGVCAAFVLARYRF